MMGRPFEYFAPKSVAEATSLLKKYGSKARLIAGGQSLVPIMNIGLAVPEHIIDLGKVRGSALSRISASGTRLAIGSMATHVQVQTSALVRQHCPILQEAAGTIGDVQVRNRGTIGGSVCHADPSGDYLAPLLVLEAELIAVNSRNSERAIGAGRFFVDVFTTSLKRDEVLTQIRIGPSPRKHAGAAYVKHRFVEGGFAIVGAAAVVSTDGSGRCNHARVALSGASARPVRLEGAEEGLVGKKVSETDIEEAGMTARDAVKEPLVDIHADAEYRREMAAVFTKRALRSAFARAANRGVD